MEYPHRRSLENKLFFNIFLPAFLIACGIDRIEIYREVLVLKKVSEKYRLNLACCARTVIETIRRKEFFDVALSDLVRSMDTLGISIDEVVEKLHEMKKTLSTK